MDGMAKMPKAVREYIATITRKGGLARAKRLTAEERSASARKAARARWRKHRPKKRA